MLGADIYKYRHEIKEVVQDVQKTNDSYRYNADGSYNTAWGASTCFEKGTLVYGKDSFIPIDSVQIGDSVYSYSFSTDQIEISKVVNTLHRETEGIYELIIGKEAIHVTAEHPFYVESKNWITVKDLQAGYKLKTSTGKIQAIKSIRQFSGKVTVYNIEVDGNHNYFVTGSTILVHNKNITQIRAEQESMNNKTKSNE